MATLRSISLAAALLLAASTFAQTPAEHSAHHPADAASAAGKSPVAPKSATPGPMSMADMEAHMKAMQAMHEKMAGAKTAQERQALLAEHMKLMQQGMAMMGGMRGGMGMGQMPGGAASAPMDPQMRQQMMEKRMDMMQSMMQMMMDRMQAMPPATK